MWIGTLWVIVGLVVLVLSVLLTLVVVMRTKRPQALVVVRRFNRRFNNPRMLRLAGRSGSALAVVRHVGRRSGTPYATPIGVLPMDDAFLAILSYGSDTDWLRNIRAAGSAELVNDGQTHQVTAAQIIGRAEALPYLPKAQLPFVRLFGVTDFLVLERAQVTSGGAPSAA
ncbi:deazaflavin-dependent oxidoreductase, nitroreductase family [Promicromonospora umidemergens]|uniref:Deazaflavin-dependent oxidoreductase (Nitroreductase family) n=1 Tax=Promicromonospora umidemergens TaxID=629679 RepID=A0ABP8XKC5_9MICO|nr:nitroreductase family deazaflavin-dependent oxidoreductase [Promicromonospora umidemergens]MCP2285621.1 deazaflavin-dependent oxidoreductase, nitroreductase family [Promicromonospora umidemergens]